MEPAEKKSKLCEKSAPMADVRDPHIVGKLF